MQYLQHFIMKTFFGLYNFIKHYVIDRTHITFAEGQGTCMSKAFIIGQGRRFEDFFAQLVTLFWVREFKRREGEFKNLS